MFSVKDCFAVIQGAGLVGLVGLVFVCRYKHQRAAGARGLIGQARGLMVGLVDQEKERAPVGALVGLARSARLVVVYAATAKGMVRY